MDRRRRLSILVPPLIALLALASVAYAASRNFVAPLSSDQEVAATPVVSDATGVAKLQLNKDGDELSYRLNVGNIENVTQAHIHIGARGTNGGIIVWLYPSASPAQLIPGRSQGTLATGTITDANLVGALAGGTIDDLLDLIRSDGAYVNVHTSQYPAGEIRGQIDIPRG